MVSDLKTIPTPQLNEAVMRFRLVGDMSRAKLLLLLSGREEFNVGQICEKIGEPQPGLSRHLGILKVGGLAEALREGRNQYYRLTPSGERAAEWIREICKD